MLIWRETKINYCLLAFVFVEWFLLYPDICNYHIYICKLWKESLSRDGKQFHQYQQNQQSNRVTEHKKGGHMHMTLNIHILAWDRQKNVSGINRLMEYLTSPLDNCISNGNIYTNNKTICTDSFPLKKTTYYYKYERPHRHGQYNSRVNECLKLIGHQLGR